MQLLQQLEAYLPANPQETQDKRVLLQYYKAYPHNILLRENEIAHITSSGFIMNHTLDKVLLVHHNIMKAWAWSGGHADGYADLLAVALREAREETGVERVYPLFEEIAALDILTVPGHWKNGRYVNAHLHLSVGYILVCDESQALRACPGENSGVAWFPVEYFTLENFNEGDVYLYNKLIDRAKLHGPCRHIQG